MIHRHFKDIRSVRRWASDIDGNSHNFRFTWASDGSGLLLCGRHTYGICFPTRIEAVSPLHFLILKTGDSAPLGLEWTFKYLKQDVGALHVVTSHNKQSPASLRPRVACLHVMADHQGIGIYIATASHCLSLTSSCSFQVSLKPQNIGIRIAFRFETHTDGIHRRFLHRERQWHGSRVKANIRRVQMLPLRKERSIALFSGP
jgi:hypothetical protein